MKEKLILSEKEAKAILWEETPYKIVRNELVDNTRWNLVYGLVVEKDGKFFRTEYQTGATESQDNSPFDYMDEVEFEEVFPVEKTITVYQLPHAKASGLVRHLTVTYR